MQQQVKNHSVKNCHCCRVWDAISCFSVTDAKTERWEHKSLKCSLTATILPEHSFNSFCVSHTHTYTSKVWHVFYFFICSTSITRNPTGAGLQGPRVHHWDVQIWFIDCSLKKQSLLLKFVMFKARPMYCFGRYWSVKGCSICIDRSNE